MWAVAQLKKLKLWSLLDCVQISISDCNKKLIPPARHEYESHCELRTVV